MRMDDRREPIAGQTLLLLLNAHHEAIDFALPECRPGQSWTRELDTADDPKSSAWLSCDRPYPLQGRSPAVFRTESRMEAGPLPA